jgi:hypothetical protein
MGNCGPSRTLAFRADGMLAAGVGGGAVAIWGAVGTKREKVFEQFYFLLNLSLLNLSLWGARMVEWQFWLLMDTMDTMKIFWRRAN